MTLMQTKPSNFIFTFYIMLYYNQTVFLSLFCLQFFKTPQTIPAIFTVLYTDISCLGGVFAKNTSRETKIFRAEWRGKFSLKTGIFRKYPSQA